MKRILSLSLCFLLIAALFSGCGGKDGDESSDPSSSSEPEAVSSAPEVPSRESQEESLLAYLAESTSLTAMELMNDIPGKSIKISAKATAGYILDSNGDGWYEMIIEYICNGSQGKSYAYAGYIIDENGNVIKLGYEFMDPAELFQNVSTSGGATERIYFAKHPESGLPCIIKETKTGSGESELVNKRLVRIAGKKVEQSSQWATEFVDNAEGQKSKVYKIDKVTVKETEYDEMDTKYAEADLKKLAEVFPDGKLTSIDTAKLPKAVDKQVTQDKSTSSAAASAAASSSASKTATGVDLAKSTLSDILKKMDNKYTEDESYNGSKVIVNQAIYGKYAFLVDSDAATVTANTQYNGVLVEPGGYIESSAKVGMKYSELKAVLSALSALEEDLMDDSFVATYKSGGLTVTIFFDTAGGPSILASITK